MKVIKSVLFSLCLGFKVFASEELGLEQDAASPIESKMVRVYKDSLLLDPGRILKTDLCEIMRNPELAMQVFFYFSSKRDIVALIRALSLFSPNPEERKSFVENMKKAFFGHNDPSASERLILGALKSEYYLPLSKRTRLRFFEQISLSQDKIDQSILALKMPNVDYRKRLFDEAVKVIDIPVAQKMLLGWLKSLSISNQAKQEMIEKYRFNTSLVGFLGSSEWRQFVPEGIRGQVDARFTLLRAINGTRNLEKIESLSLLSEETSTERDLKIFALLVFAQDQKIQLDEEGDEDLYDESIEEGEKEYHNQRLKAAKFLLERYKGVADDSIVQAHKSIIMSEKVTPKDRIKEAKIISQSYHDDVRYHEDIIEALSHLAKDLDVYEDQRLEAVKLMHDFRYRGYDGEIIKTSISIARDRNVLVKNRLVILKKIMTSYPKVHDDKVKEILLSILSQTLSRNKKVPVQNKWTVLKWMISHFPELDPSMRKSLLSFIRDGNNTDHSRLEAGEFLAKRYKNLLGEHKKLSQIFKKSNLSGTATQENILKVYEEAVKVYKDAKMGYQSIASGKKVKQHCKDQAEKKIKKLEAIYINFE